MAHATTGARVAVVLAVVLAAMLVSACASRAKAPPPDPVSRGVSPQAARCIEQGWQRATLSIGGLSRQLLWKGPASGRWDKGAIIVLHGGGGQHFQWCAANVPIAAPQVRFSVQALAEGFAVFLLNSSDRVTDTEGRVCGKVWDDEVRDRPNLDLPFIGAVMRELLPRLRPPGSAREIFLTGLSSGGYMTSRAATHFDDVVTAFAPVSSGDPYGWHRVCESGMTARKTVHGAGFDNETQKQIIERDACRADAYPHEKTWDSANPVIKPKVTIFHHEHDGINDWSCGQKISRMLRRHGYRAQPDVVLTGGRRSLGNHLWQDAYNRPLLDFFAAQVGAGGK